MAALSLSPRPAPPSEQISSRTLHPIYQALDTHNYTKALKLTSSSNSNWDIIRALRVHALERSGKRREALVLLWELLVSHVILPGSDTSDGSGSGSGGKRSKQEENVWIELYERIVSLTDATDLINDTPSLKNNSGLDIQLLDATQRLDIRAYAPLALPKKVEVLPANASSSASTTNKTSSSSSSKGKKGGKGKQSKKTTSTTTSSASSAASVSYPPITDETVLQTICVTLRIEGLYDTMSEMYNQAMETLTTSSSIATTTTMEEQNNVAEILEEGVCVHFKAVCDCTDVGSIISSDNQDDVTIVQGLLPKLKTILNQTKYYERMQSSSLQLAKITSQPLHFQWTAISSLWYKTSIEKLVAILEKMQPLLTKEDGKGRDDAPMKHLQSYALAMLGLVNVTEISSYCQKLQQKVALLPRLAESLSSRMVRTSQTTVSENDWDVYLETLLVQDKKNEALEVLTSMIQGTPMSGGSGSSDDDDASGGNAEDDNNVVVPQIDDEHTIENHVGSMLPYTQRKKLERCAQLLLELGMYADAEGYYRELLTAFPDQWTYWLGLIDACVWRKSASATTDADMEEGGEEATMNEDGWQRVHSLAKDVISATSSTGQKKHALRGPRLILLELATIKIRSSAIGEGNGGLTTALRDEILAYGNKFGPATSCCFADIRSYLKVLVDGGSSSESVDGIDNVPNDVSSVLKWAKELWASSCQSNDDDASSSGGEVSSDEFRERRKKIRTYIFAVQVVHAIAVEYGNLTSQLLNDYAPSTTQMVTEWRTSLSFLPGVAPKDGGQKEVLPGDEIMLLTSQYLQFQATNQSSCDLEAPFLLQAAGLLEEAMDQSPYNPHLKIAAIGVYSQLHAAHRALSIYEDLDVKQIQLDSCSYLILPTLMRGGLYTSAIKLSSSILRLHGSTSKDVKEYASKALRNGLIFKAKEMAAFQTDKMRPSLQLLYSKGLVVDAAPLLIPSDLVRDSISSGAAKQAKGKAPSSRLGMEKGFCGDYEDFSRAEQLAVDAELHFNAPSVIHAAAQSTSTNHFVASDNRDMTINNFEILFHNAHLTQDEMLTESLRRGHMHGLMSRAVMAASAANAPKKGKIPKSTEETMYRSQSLSLQLSRAKEFGQVTGMDQTETALWDACCKLCETILVVMTGTDGENDTLAKREQCAVSIVESATQLVQTARAALALICGENKGISSSGANICELLPNHIVPCYVLLETTANLFALFGWGKRKRMTKTSSGALANLALSFRDLIEDMLQSMIKFRSFPGANDESMVDNTEVGKDVIQRAITEVVSSREMTIDRVDPFLTQMQESLQTFDDQ